MQAKGIVIFLVGLALIAGATSARAADRTWTGAGSNQLWTEPGNWDVGTAPAHPTDDQVFFLNQGYAENDAITSILDPANLPTPSQVWTIGPLMVRNPISGEATDINHRLDLNGNQLIVNGDLGVANYTSKPSGDRFTTTFRVGNGTLQIGSDLTARNIYVGIGDSSRAIGHFIMMPGSSLEAYLNNVIVGRGYPGRGYGNSPQGIIDLRGCTIVGGTLKANNIHLAEQTGGWWGSSNGEFSIYLDDNMGLQTIEIANDLYIGSGHDSVESWFGDPANDYKLPANVNLKIGSKNGDVITRGNLHVGWIHNYGWSTLDKHAQLSASSGGTMEAYLTDFIVGRHSGWGNNMRADMDLRPMTSVIIDAVTMRIGESGSGVARGYLSLPGNATVSTDNLIAGGSNGNSAGVIELEPGATFTVNEAITLNNTADVIVNVSETSSGLELGETTTITANGAGEIQILFDQPQSETETGLYYGLKWTGNHLAELQNLISDGVITTDPGLSDGTVTSTYDEATNTTYLAVASELVVTAVTKDITVEAASDTEQVTISAEDVDAGSVYPDGYNITGYYVVSSDDLIANDDTVTLAGYGAHTVTLIVTIDAFPPVMDSTDCTVTIEPSAEVTYNTVTWSGGASLTNMTRKQWSYSTNWLAGQAPATDTTADVLFSTAGSAADGSVTNSIDVSRTVGTLKVCGPASGTDADFQHTFDLQGQRLTVTGDLWVNWFDPDPSGNVRTATARFQNGTLQVGTAEAPTSIVMAKSWNETARGNLILPSGITFEPHLNNIIISRGFAAPGGIIDLRGCNISGGLLSANNIHLGENPSWYGSANGEASIYIDDETNLQTIDVSGDLHVANGHLGFTGFFGDPANDYKLPADVNVIVGNKAGFSRGEIIVGRIAQGGLNGAKTAVFSASSGGSMNAYVTSLIVGQHAGDIGTPCWAEMDLRPMNSVAIDAENMHIGDGYVGQGYLWLPSNTTASTGTLVVGGADSRSVGVLDLAAGSELYVDTSVTLNNTADMTVRVGSESGGLDLAETAQITAADNGKLTLVFEQPAAATGMLYGLRWFGNHAAELQALADSGNLAWDEDAVGAPVEIFTAGDYTYVGVAGGVARITSVGLADATSGSTLYTNDATVSVAPEGVAAEGQVVVWWAITESDTEPTDGWGPLPTSYTIQATPGQDVTVYAWLKDSADNVASLAETIYYQPAEPVVTNLTVTEITPTEVQVTWDTDIETYGFVRVQPTTAGAEAQTIAEGPRTTTHMVRINGLVEGTVYQLTAINNEKEEAPISYPQLWPIEGDANMDCKVNIIDLIFVRNRLNQNVGSEDNWQADVNGDGKINIIDLIYVRNRLNTKCAE